MRTRVVNHFSKQSFFVLFFDHFQNDRFVLRKKKQSFLKMAYLLRTFRKQITIVFENDRFCKNNKQPFFIRLVFKKGLFNDR